MPRRKDGEHSRWLKHNRLIPLDDLFAVDRNSPELNVGTQRGGFYAESWGLVHYLLAEAERSRRLLGYLELLGRGQRHNEAFAEAFGSETETLERELRAYVRGAALPVTAVPVKPLAGDDFVERPMSYGEVLYRPGELLAQQEEHVVEAEKHYRRALATFADEVTAADVEAGETARRLLPSRDDVAAHLLVLYAKRGEHEAAARLYDEHLAAAGDAEDRRQALAVLVALELREAQGLVNAGRGEEALGVLAGLERRVDGTEEASRIGTKSALLRTTIERNRLAERFNEAVELYNSLELDAALELLEKLLPELPEGDLKRRARELVEDIRPKKDERTSQDKRP